MTKPVTRKMAVDCLLHRIIMQFGKPLVAVSTGEELLPGMDIQFDHIHADVHGGAHEYENLRPLPRLTHQRKTKADVQAKAKIDRITGITGTKRKSRKMPTGQKLKGRGFQKVHKPMRGKP